MMGRPVLVVLSALAGGWLVFMALTASAAPSAEIVRLRETFVPTISLTVVPTEQAAVWTPSPSPTPVPLPYPLPGTLFVPTPTATTFPMSAQGAAQRHSLYLPGVSRP